MITVRLPSTLLAGGERTLAIDDPVGTVADLIDAIDKRVPGFRDQLDDAVFNFAVNDEMVLHRARSRALQDGDVVEIIPTIAGGCPPAPSHGSDEADGDDHDGQENPYERVRIA